MFLTREGRETERERRRGRRRKGRIPYGMEVGRISKELREGNILPEYII